MTAPVVLSVLAGLTNNIFIGLASGLTTRWLGEVWALYRGTIFLSLGIALACLACTGAGRARRLLHGAAARAPDAWSRNC